MVVVPVVVVPAFKVPVVIIFWLPKSGVTFVPDTPLIFTSVTAPSRMWLVVTALSLSVEVLSFNLSAVTLSLASLASVTARSWLGNRCKN